MTPPKVENGDDSQSSTPEYRDRLRTWLIKMIDSGTIVGLRWENEEKTIFRMPWKHAGRQDYSLEEDSRIFMAWAIHSGRYREGIDKPEPITWKTRLRCALNKMPDIREIPERSRLDISEPYRVYNLLPPVHKDTQIRRRLQRRHSSAQKVDSAKQLPLHQTSHSYSAKDSNGPSSAGHLPFPDPRLQDRAGESALGTTRLSELSQGAPWTFRNAAPWFGTSPLVPTTENPLLQRLNFNSFPTPANFRGFVNPYSLLSSAPHRDLRQHRDHDFPMFPYQSPVLDCHPVPPFFMPGVSPIGRLPLGGNKPFSAAAAFGRSQSSTGNATDSVRSHEIFNNAPSEERDEASHKIELLELEAAKWKRAYEKERVAREETETRHENLKTALENVGGDLRAIVNREYSNGTPNEDTKSEDNPQQKSTAFQANLTPSRRRSADDNKHVTAAVTSRPVRYSAEGRTHENCNILEPKKDWDAHISPRRRHIEDDCSSMQALDLSSRSPTKRARSDSHTRCKDPSASGSRFCGHSAVSGCSHTTTPRGDESGERKFRFPTTSSRIICDEAEIQASSNARPPVISPSASSSCSSADDALQGASWSPSVTRISPLIPIFRSPDSNTFPSYSGRVDGPIQVT